MNLLSFGESNTKLARGHDLGFISAILSLSPADMAGNGKTVCVNASIQCRNACLNESGRAAMQSVQDARKRKTLAYFANRAAFVAELVDDLEFLKRKSLKDNMPVCVRLNGTSDLGWTRIRCEKDGVIYPNVMTAFPAFQFYDYTKVPGRITSDRPANYHLTFSLSEDNDVDALRAIDSGMNVAAVINVAKTEPMPETWSGYPVIDGDLHDFRFLDPHGVIVGLRPKAKAKKLTPGGFLRSVDDTFDTSRIPVYAISETLHAFAAD